MLRCNGNAGDGDLRLVTKSEHWAVWVTGITDNSRTTIDDDYGIPQAETAMSNRVSGAELHGPLCVVLSDTRTK